MMNENLHQKILSSGWQINCPNPQCNNNVLGREVQERSIIATCPSCTFRYSIPFLWYHLSATQMMDYLMENIHPMHVNVARRWIYSLKYTHPTYRISQEAERKAARSDLREVLGIIINDRTLETENLKILLVGANCCCELDDLPFTWKEENVVAVDVTEDTLCLGMQRYPKVKYCCSFVEELTSNSVDTTGKPLNHSVRESFDVCLALRVLQSSRLTLGSALTRIRDALKPRGKVVISVPRSTAIITAEGGANMRPGVFKGNRFDEEWPKQETERIAHELTSGGFFQYHRVVVYYGSHQSPEYYITAERN